MKPILEITNPDEFLDLDYRLLAEGRVDVTEKDFRHIFGLCDGFWMHNGDPTMPHAELISGKHSNGYINCGKPLSYPRVCELMAYQTARVVRSFYDGPIDWVIGSDHASATLTFALASIMCARHEFTEKGPNDTQVWKRHTIEDGQTILQCEELMTTSKTTLAVRKGIREGNPNPVTFAPVIAVMAHRSNATAVEDTSVVFAYHFDIEVWGPDDCPLCKGGSEALRPKGNWARLTGKA